MRKRRSVALLIETSNAYARGLLAGIMAYVRQHTPWSIYLPELGGGDVPPTWRGRGSLASPPQPTPWSIYLPELGRGDVPPTWRGDGIIARIETPEIARRLARTR